MNWIIKLITRENQSIGLNPKKKIKKNSWLISWLSILNKMILKMYPKDFEMKNVWTPNINIPINPLINPRYLAPLNPIDSLRITGNGSPLFCEMRPIRFVRKNTIKPANNVPLKTTKLFKSYNKYKDAINEKLIILWIETAQKLK